MDSVSHVTCVRFLVCTDGSLCWRLNTLKLDTHKNCTTPDFTQQTCQWGLPAELLNTSQGNWRENYMTTITTQQRPKSIPTPSPTPTNTSSATRIEFFFLPARLKMHVEHLLLEAKNTTAPKSACLRASENTMHFHKRIFTQPWLAWVRLSWWIWITSIHNDQKLFSE